MQVGTLRAILRLDDDDFQRGVSESTRKFGGMRSAVATGAKAMAKSIVAVGAAAGAAAISAARHGDQIAKAARAAGVSTATYAELERLDR